MNNLIPFSFESNEIRVVEDASGEPLFVAKDVLVALEYAIDGGVSKYIKHVPDEWRGGESISTPGGTQQMAVLAEQGLYFFVARSDKPKALPFQKWIAGDVIPSIRKTGKYAPSPQHNNFTQENIADPALAALVQTVVELDKVKQEVQKLGSATRAIYRRANSQFRELADRVEQVEISHRNGVPEGFLSKKQAYHIYGEGFSSEVFHLAMVRLGVFTKTYIHRNSDGYEVPSVAYLAEEVLPAVEALIDSAHQCTATLCESPLLGSKRFRYIKEA